MLKYVNYNIVFQEIPNETTLAINLSCCPNRCPSCHSADLQKNIGEELNEKVILQLIKKYKNSVTSICFMGGDNDPAMVEKLAGFIRRMSLYQIKVGWYSGKQNLPNNFALKSFNFIKLGPYITSFGALTSPTTNQRFYQIEQGEMIDKTALFTKKSAFAKLSTLR